MLGRVVVENGVKKIVPLTADCGSGNPVGTVIAVYSNKVPNGYLPCNGVQFDTAQFPVLYALLGDDHTPDLRECTLVGIGQSDRTMGAHDVYTVGQFKDDQLQDHLHTVNRQSSTGSTNYNSVAFQTVPAWRDGETNAVKSASARTGTTTHGKQVGVNWCIKATSGINENQADNVLSALSPVDVVALNNVHSVTSNAVARKINSLTHIKDLTDTSYTSFLQIPMGVYSISGSIYRNYTDKPANDTEGRIIFISGAWGAESDEQICLLATARHGHLYLGHCYGGTPRYDWIQII